MPRKKASRGTGAYLSSLTGDYLPRAWAVLSDRGALLAGALALALIQLAVLSALAVTASLLWHPSVSACACLGLFTLGHLHGAIAGATSSAPSWLRWPSEALRVSLVPNFEGLNAGWTVAAGRAIPASYLACALCYGAAWTGAVLLVGLAIFDRRELL